MEKINVQVYSLVSEQMTPAEKLQTIAKLGYTGAEFTLDFTQVPIEEMKKIIAETGLEVPSAHVALDKIEEVLPYFAELGTKYVICPMTDFANKEEAKEVAEELNRLGHIAKQYGIKVGYHNHAHEFETMDGKYILDLIAEGTSEDVILEIDVFWVLYAGVDPYKYIEKWGKRVELVHLKQIAADKKTDTILEDGIIDMKKIVDSAKFATHLVVEQEGDVDEVDASKKNIEFLRKIF